MFPATKDISRTKTGDGNAFQTTIQQGFVTVTNYSVEGIPAPQNLHLTISLFLDVGTI